MNSWLLVGDMKKTLRPYQAEAVDEIIDSWNGSKGKAVPYASVMTGLGKSLIAADLTDKALKKGKRVLQLVPRKELVEQNYQECFEYISNPSEIGICCGQLGKHQVNRRAVIAMASSFVSRRVTSGAWDILIIDECHNVKVDALDEKPSTYTKIIKSLLRINPKMLICGFSGTPYRADTGGMLHEKNYKGTPIWTDIVYDTSVYPGMASLISDGYLSPIKTLNTSIKVDLDGVRTSGKDYNKEDLGVKFEQIVDDAIGDMKLQFIEHNIKTALIFASTLDNAKHILERWGDPSTMRIVSGQITQSERKNTIEWLKNGTGCRYIINVDILAVGFDYRALQAVVLMRATKSVGLFVQIAGRIIRPHQDKEHGFLLDYGTNIERLGSLDNINVPKPKKRKQESPKKLCLVPECGAQNPLTAKKCIKCGAFFIASESEDGDYKMRTAAEAIALEEEANTLEHAIGGVMYEVVLSKLTQIPMIKMDFYGDHGGKVQSHWLCLNHTGFAGQSARRFLKRMFKNEEDFYKLGAVGVTVENIFPLFDSPVLYEQFFKKIVGIQTRPQKKNKKYTEIKNIAFEQVE